MRRLKNTISSAFFVIASLLLLATCEIGLGPQVDTDTPVIAITSPDIGKSLKDSVSIKGTCGDDSGVVRIDVSLRDSDGKSRAVGQISKDMIDSGSSWSIDADTSDYPDATYEIVAEAYDAAGRHATATRSVNIDNTPPVVLFSKPNSLSEIGDGNTYGGTVTIAGEIIDDHEIAALYIQAFDADGNRIVLPGEARMDDADEDDEGLWQKFENFDVQGGVSLTIAQYAENPDSLSDENAKRLALNYKALYGGDQSDTSKTVTCRIFAVAVDESGNRSSFSYVKSALNELVSSKTGIPVAQLTSLKYKTVANKTCEEDGTFTAARQDLIRDILDNPAKYAGTEYASGAGGNGLMFSICADNSPKYVVSGFSLENGDFTTTSSMGTLPLEVSVGLDRFQILPDSLDVTLYKADDSGNYNPSSEPLFTTKDAAEGSDGWQTIYSSDGGSRSYTKDATTPVDDKTYTIQLPVIVAGTKVAVVVDGEDEAGNKLVPKDGTYGFEVARTGGAPRVKGDDQFYLPKSAFQSGGTQTLDLSIYDTSGVFDDCTQSSIEITPSVYEGHYLKTNYASGSGTQLPKKTYTYDGSIISKTDGSGTDFTARIPFSALGITLGSADNYTIVLSVVAKNGPEDSDKEQSTYLVWADCAGPVIELSNPWTEDAGQTVTPNDIQETSAFWNRMTYAEAKKQSGVTDIISLNGLDVPDGTMVNVYDIRGYWKDSAGSGTDALYFQIADSAAELIEARLDTTLDENLKPTGQSWIQIDTTNTTPGATTRFAITNAQIVREGTGTAIAFFAVDNVGNKSPVYKFSKLVFDFGEPQIETPAPGEYYSASAEPLVLAVKATDSNLMQSIRVEAKKDGAEVQSGASGYTFTPGEAVSRTDATSPLEAAAQLFDAERTSGQEAEIQLSRTGAADGSWQFTVTATDVNGRSHTAAAFGTTIDSVAPVANEGISIGGEAHDDDASWYKNKTLRVSGSYKEETSGVDAVYFAVLSSDAADAVRTAVDAAVTSDDITALSSAGKIIVGGTKGTLVQYTITPSGFEPGDNVLYVQAVDKAGNKSAVSRHKIKIDQDSPSLDARWFTYGDGRFESAGGTVYANKKSDLVLYGSVSDLNSGVAPFDCFVVGGTQVQADFTYSSAQIADGGETDSDDERAELFSSWISENGGSFSAYSTADATGIRSWKAVIKKENIAEGAVKLTAKDVAGNTMPQTFFTLVVDSTSPSVSLSVPAAGAQLNGDIDFRGTTTDNTSLRTVSLWYSYTSSDASIGGGDNPVVIDGKEAVLSDSDAYNWEFEGLPVTYSEDGAIKLLGGVAYADSAKDIWFKLRAVDIAGNETVSVFAFKADPDGDRPHIVLSNIAADGQTLLKSAEVYGSVTDDDGTIRGLWYTGDSTLLATPPTESNANGWSKIEVSNGSFTVRAQGGDGRKEWWLYCIDGEGGTFSTLEGTKLRRPYVSFTDETDKDLSEAITFQIDTTPPEVKDIQLSQAATGTATTAADWAADDSVTWFAEGNHAFGGTKNVMYVRFTVTEATGMDSASPVLVSVGGKQLDLAGKLHVTSASSVYTYTAGPIVLDGTYDNSSQALSVVAKDSAGTSSQLSKNIVVDNEAPTVSFEYPTSDVRVTSTVEVRGSVSDNAGGAGVSSIKWMIPTLAERTAGVGADTQRGGKSAWTELAETSAISIPFMSRETGDVLNIMTYANTDYDEREVNDEGNQTGLWDIPLYFLVTDNLGNQRIDTGHTVIADTEGGLPTATIIYPSDKDIVDGEEKQTVGGTLNVYGSATDDEAVAGVRVQLDVNGDSTFDNADYNLVSAWGESSLGGYTLVSPSSESAADWYLAASGTSSWRLTVDTSKVSYEGHTGEIGDDNPVMGIRARAYDEQGNSRGWSKPVYVTIDKGVPVIGALKVVGYRNGEAEVEREYSSGMYISGHDSGIQWYLEGELSDDVSVGSAEFDNLGAYIQIGEPDLTEAEPGSERRKNMKARLDVTRDGQMYSRLTVVDDNNKQTSQDIRINVDSTAPSLFTMGGETTADASGSLRLTSGTNQVDEDKNFVQNTNVVYSFGDSVEEEGSGLSFVAFYFVRKSATNGDRVYNPMFADGNRTDITQDGLSINGDGLAVLSAQGTRGADDEFASESIADNPNIRKGGLIKIGGAYRLITNVSGNKVTFSPTVDVKYTEAELVYAQVVDNRVIEGPTMNGTTPDYTTVSSDDGDGMIESLKETDGLYTWSASIFSDRIPDGPVEIHVVAIDAAGNISQGWCPSAVYNNRPRIAKVLLGTELNGNGTYDFTAASAIQSTGEGATASGREFGEFVYYSALGSDGKERSEVALTAAAENPFILKNGMLLLPEFVGGNGSLSATYRVAESEAAAGKTTNATGKQKALTPKGGLSSKVQTGEGSAQSIGDHISDFGGLLFTNDELSEYESRTKNGTTAKWFAITFWDATEEKTPGVDSQWALLSFPVIVDTKDDIAPTVELSPFYWESKDDNSVYRNSRGELLGHIELLEDWKKGPGYVEGAQSGEWDGDPKVSGLIRIQGTASDETRLGKLAMTIDGFNLADAGAGNEAVLATYNGTWVYADESSDLSLVESRGWSFAVTDSGVTQEGHFVSWELDIDTSRIAGVAALDRTITVTAYDSANKESGSLRVDVVPYITVVETSLSAGNKGNPSVVNRTALGHYPVWVSYAGDLEDAEKDGKTTSANYEKVKLYGYNLAAQNAPVDLQLDKGSRSGTYNHKVGDVEAINNYNHNDAHGSYDYTGYGYSESDLGSSGNAEVYANWYNRRPNGENNNNLTDDVLFDVWQFNTKAAVPRNNSALDVVMKVNPSSSANGRIGFAFADGDLHWSMANGTSSSYTDWANTADFIQSTGFAFDKNGLSYGTAAGGESGTNSADTFNFFYSKWSATTSGYIYSGNNSLRIGSIAQGSADNMAKDRFQNPAIASDGTNVYLAYFDLLTGRIMFKSGPGLSGKASKAGAGNFQDAHGGVTSYGVDDSKYAQIVADGEGNGLGCAGEYLSLGVVPGKAVVMVWYDAQNKNLMYAYNTELDKSRHGQLVAQGDKYRALNDDGSTVNTGWNGVKPLIEGAGEFCQLAVDGAGGIHVAAFDRANGDLKYAYIPQYDSKDIKTCTVDSYQSVGWYITIDVAKSEGYQIPHIGYWGTKRVRYATLTKEGAALFYGGTQNDGTERDGVADDFYTGVWECTVVPTQSALNEGDTKRRINVGVWKDAGGNLIPSTDGSSQAASGSGNCYGNGTDNAVLGYSIQVTGGGRVETAQMREVHE